MLPWETIIPFFTASVLLGIAPGPDNLFVLTQSVWQGRTAGLLVVLGLCTGLVVHTGAAALGVAALVRASPTAFAALKFAGAAYLLYLAWCAFHAGGPGASDGASRVFGCRILYRRGIIMNVTNPKVLLFFLAFLPQFADPGRGSVTLQLLLLGGVFILATLLVFGTLAVLAGTVGQWLLRSHRAQRILSLLAGAIFVGLALKLVASQP